MAKGIEKTIEKFCVETCVYWGNPQNNGYGGLVFDTAVEIPCRWENKKQIITDSDGRDRISQSQALLTQDVDIKGYLFRGTIADIPVGTDLTQPVNIKDAEMIIQFDRIPMVKKTDEFVRTAYLFNYGD